MAVTFETEQLLRRASAHPTARNTVHSTLVYGLGRGRGFAAAPCPLRAPCSNATYHLGERGRPVAQGYQQTADGASSNRPAERAVGTDAVAATTCVAVADEAGRPVAGGATKRRLAAGH